MGTPPQEEPRRVARLPRPQTAELPFDALDHLGADELRQRVRSLQAILETAPVPIAIAHDPDCRYISANSALAALLGLPTDVNISLTPPAGESPAYRIQRQGRDVLPEDLPMQQAIRRRALVSNEIEIVRPDGTVAYIQNDVQPLFDMRGDVYGCVSVCVDITDRKLSEFSLREADRKKDEFLATLSHELRNPLAPLRSALEVLRLGQGQPELFDRARQTMERQLRHLVRITDDLLDVARVTHGKMHLHRERLDLRDVLQSALEAARPALEARAHTLTVDVPASPLPVDADGTRLGQVFANLLNNAAKFTAPGGIIHVRMTRAGGTATVAVQDNGVGIAPPMLPAVFDLFTQLQRVRNPMQGGLGIGLTLARRLVELHGGTVEAASEGEGRGSTFTVVLPAVEGAGIEDAGRADRMAPAACRILIADDNPDTLDMMHLMLTLRGHAVHGASDGIAAVALADTVKPQIAFLDIGMPRMDGYEAARRIRKDLGPHVVLVALTGWGQDEDKQRAHDAGFDHHLTKPPDPEVLDELIAACSVAPSSATSRSGE